MKTKWRRWKELFTSCVYTVVTVAISFLLLLCVAKGTKGLHVVGRVRTDDCFHQALVGTRQGALTRWKGRERDRERESKEGMTAEMMVLFLWSGWNVLEKLINHNNIV